MSETRQPPTTLREGLRGVGLTVLLGLAVIGVATLVAVVAVVLLR